MRRGRIWLAQVFVSQARTERELLGELRAIRGTGASVVVIRAFHLRGDSYHRLAPEGAPPEGVYFRSEGSPLVADFLPGYVRAAHAEGLEVWGWMTTRKCRWLLDRVPDGAEHVRDGDRLLPGPDLDLFHPDVLAALDRLYHDLGATGVDGILFQDDLALRMDEGFGPHAERELGLAGPEVGQEASWYLQRAEWLIQVGKRLLSSMQE